MRRQCHLVEINSEFIRHKTGTVVPVRLNTHVNKHVPHANGRRAEQEKRNDKGSERTT
jgi:hypothetical protein